MDNKSPGVFNMAFVDILAGALGAVILLFVIVPKMDSTSAQALEKIEILEEHSVSLDSLIADISYLIPRDKAEELNRLNDSIKTRIHDLRLEVELLTIENEELKTNVLEYEKDIKRYKWRIEFLEGEMQERPDVDLDKVENELIKKTKELKKRNKEVEDKKAEVLALKDSIDNDLVLKSDENEKGETMWLMGMNPELAIILEWDDDLADVDLYLERDGKFCDEENRKTSFGQWVKLPKRMRTGNSEFIIQKELETGTFGVYAHLYRPKKDFSVEVRGSAYLHPDRTKYNKAEFGTFEISNTRPPYKNDGGIKLGDLIVTESSIHFETNKSISKN